MKKDPTIHNIFMTAMKLEKDGNNDPDVREVRKLIKDFIKEEVNIEDPFDLMNYGIKLLG